MLRDIEQHKRKREEIKEEKDKVRKTPISHIIGGVIGFMVISTLLMLLASLLNK